jgi:anti-sigma factor RsiW
MANCNWEQQVEAYFDGFAGKPAEVEAHLHACAECTGLLQHLQTVRAGVQAIPRPRVIEDAQFNAFMAGIREGIEAPARSHRGFWAALSLVSAALVVSVAVFSMFTGPAPVKATEVKATSTQIEGATVDVNVLDGVMTISLTPPPQRYEEDIQ